MLRAYLDSQAVVAGGVIGVHAIGGASGSVRRLHHSDPNPTGPGIVEESCYWGQVTFDVEPVPPRVGSFAIAEGCLTAPFTLSCWIWPTDLSEACVIASWLGTGGTEWSLVVEAGFLNLTNGTTMLSVPSRIRERDWHFVGAVIGQRESTVFAGTWGRTGGPFLVPDFDVIAAPVDGGDLVIGSYAKAPVSGRLDGCIAGLRIDRAGLDIVELMHVMNGEGPPGALSWRLDDSADPDTAPGRPPLTLLNAPARSTLIPPPVDTSARSLVPPGSVHFHKDDVEDCAWPLAATVAVPPDAPSGVYSLSLTDGAEVFELPFIVTGSGPVALLIPTLTWQAYANLGRDPRSWPGRSHYSLHSDGSPVIVTTARRPSQTFAPGARLEVDEGDGFSTGEVLAHLLTADLYAWTWLRETGTSPVVIDDRTLHAQGSAALKDVRVLVLSAHPEYWTSAMLDALQAYLDRGGNLIYLGGNGLYWVTSLHPRKPHLMEVRRWGGSQTCSVEQDNRRHQYEPVTGGLWQESGRPPDQFVSVGFAGFGAGGSLEYRRTTASQDPQWAWVFEGVHGDSLGGAGINVGAGNEFDSHRGLGPGESVILASAKPRTPDHFGVFERGPRRAPDDQLRADMTMTRTPAGGLVFATSAITASGCLVGPGEADGLRRVCTNVLREMLNPGSSAG